MLGVWMVVFAGQPLRFAGLDLRLGGAAAGGLADRASPAPWCGVTAALAALAIYKHKANIQRLRNGTESRLQLGGKKTNT